MPNTITRWLERDKGHKNFDHLPNMDIVENDQLSNSKALCGPGWVFEGTYSSTQMTLLPILFYSTSIQKPFGFPAQPPTPRAQAVSLKGYLQGTWPKVTEQVLHLLGGDLHILSHEKMTLSYLHQCCEFSLDRWLFILRCLTGSLAVSLPACLTHAQRPGHHSPDDRCSLRDKKHGASCVGIYIFIKLLWL